MRSGLIAEMNAALQVLRTAPGNRYMLSTLPVSVEAKMAELGGCDDETRLRAMQLIAAEEMRLAAAE